jgi:hypothetical protein
MEIGHLIGLLKKGNINAIWAITSPRVVSTLAGNRFAWIMTDLRNLVQKNLSRVSHHSIRGMALSQMSDATKRAHVRDPSKSYATAVRTLEFGIRLLSNGELKFQPPTTFKPDEGGVEKALKQLDDTYASSPLPEMPPAEVFDRWLYTMRLRMMREETLYFAMRGKHVKGS